MRDETSKTVNAHASDTGLGVIMFTVGELTEAFRIGASRRDFSEAEIKELERMGVTIVD